MPLAATLALTAMLVAPAAREGGGVALSFRWPDGLRCQVERKSRTTRGKTGGEETLWYELLAKRAGSGWLIRRIFLGVHDAAGMPPRDPQPWVDRLPPYRVRASGRFVALALEPATRARLRAKERKWQESVPPGFTRGMTFPQGEVALGRQAADEWNFLVEEWAGGVVEPDQTLTEEAVVPVEIPFLGTRRLPRKQQLRVSGPVACPGGGPATCIELRTEVTPDLERYNRSFALGLREAGKVAKDKPPETPESTTKVIRMTARRTLVTDPATLIPRSVIEVHEVDTEIGGKVASMTRERIDTYRCTP